MKRVTRELINVALQAIRSAYYNEADPTNGVEVESKFDFDNETVKKIGEVLQAVGDLSRSL